MHPGLRAISLDSQNLPLPPLLSPVAVVRSRHTYSESVMDTDSIAIDEDDEDEEDSELIEDELDEVEKEMDEEENE